MFLGLDLGDKTLGIAKTDPFNMFASPLKVIRHDNDFEYLLEEIIKITNEYKIEKLILGYPLNMDGTIGPRAKKTLKFQKYLEKRGFVVELIDERLTSMEAESMMIKADLSRSKRKKKVDKMAAAIILERYLKELGG